MIFVALVFASALASIIPALVVKILMLTVFGRSVSYLMILGVMVATFVLASMIVLGLGYDTEASLTTMPDWLALVVFAITFGLQVLVLGIVASDEHARLVGFGKWAVILLLQYVVYFVFGLLLVFTMAA